MLEHDPYRPPQSVAEEPRDSVPEMQSVSDQPTSAIKAIFALVFIVIPIIVGLTLLGDFAGTTIAKSLGQVHGELFDVRDFGSIKHWLGFALLVVGAFVGAILPEVFSRFRNGRAGEDSDSTEVVNEAIRLLSPRRDARN